MKSIEHWKQQFIKLWMGQSISLLTSSVLQMAIVWYLTERTGSSAVLAVASLVAYVPQAILGSFIGVYIDRYNRKKIMIYADLGMALASIFLIVVGSVMELPVWVIMVSLGIRSVGAAFHYPALQAVTPSIVPKEYLTKYAGYAQGFESISMIISPALAAVLFRIWDLSFILWFDVAGAVLAVLLLCFVAIPEQKRVEKEQQEKANTLQELKDGFAILKRDRELSVLMMVGALYAVIYYPIGTLYPMVTIQHFEGTIADSSIVEILFSVGMLVGSVLLGIYGEKLNKRRVLIGSILVYGIGVTVTGMLSPEQLPVFIVLSGIMGVAVPFYTGVETAIYQTRVEEQYLGRVLSLTGSVVTITMPIGLALSAIFTDRIGIGNWFFILGVTTILLALVTSMLPSLKKVET